MAVRAQPYSGGGMDEVHSWTAALTDSVLRVARAMLEYLPNVVGSVALLVIGWALARLLRRATYVVAGRALERLARQRLARTKAIDAKTQQSQTFQSVPVVISGIVYWTILLFFVAAGVEALGLPAVSNVVALVTAYLPRVLAAVLIVFIGLWAGEFSRTIVTRTASRTEVAYPEVVGRSIQVLVLLVFLIIAIDQLGIDSTILVLTLTVVFATTFGAAALAFGLGARTTVANIIASRYVRRNYQAGDSVRIGDVEGQISEISNTVVVLEGSAGRVMVPSAHFLETTSTLLRRGG